MRTLFLALILAATAPAAHAQTTLVSDWVFTRSAVDIAAASGADFDRASWGVIRVPHDWAVAGPFDPAADGSTGKLPWKGEGWYRSEFTLEGARTDQRVYFDFDGVMAFPKVYINGQLAGEWDYGYTPFRIDATPLIRWGETNTIVVHVNTERWGSRWYPGAGIYRKVTMTVAEPIHLAQWGTHVWTNGDEAGGTPPNRAFVQTTVENHTGEPQDVEIMNRLDSPEGAIVAVRTRAARIQPHSPIIVEARFDVTDPTLWDIDTPMLYTVTTTILTADEVVVDRSKTRFGFRTFAFTGDDGFHLNGRRVQMKGVNLHHDLGPLGGAFNRRAAERQLLIMKEMGVNALRTSHNPPAAEVLQLADELGIVVFNEVFDKWDYTSGRPDLQPPLFEYGHRHIKNTVLRDRNSPSVVLWSIGNELGGEDRFDGINPERMAMMTGFVRAYDPNRPVGMGNHIQGLVDGKNFASLDVNGWNYGRRYQRDHEVWPDRSIIYSESASALSTRGYYDPDLAERKTDYPAHFKLSSYDLTAAEWSDIPDMEFRLMEDDAFVAGEFVWTGFDYIGEPTPFTKEARSSYFGIADLCGFPKDRYYLYQSHWRPDHPTVHILPHWNWPERVGQNVPVFVYTSGDSAELFLNGKSLGKRVKGEVPARAANLASGAVATASSTASATASSESSTPALALDGDLDTGWRAAPGDKNAWWQVDLGAVQQVGYIGLDTALEEKRYAYTLTASTDGDSWTPVAEKETSLMPMWGGPSRVYHTTDLEARFLRISFTDVRENAPIGLNGFTVYAERVENEYYDVTYDYRLRWNDVAYEPGTLRAVAYRDGVVIGESEVSTVGEAQSLRLQADRPIVRADGEELVFVTIEAVDAEGRAHPLADHPVQFSVTGPATLAGSCSGDPMSLESFQGTERNLFYGKALLVIRPNDGQGGDITISAESEGLAPTSIQLKSVE